MDKWVLRMNWPENDPTETDPLLTREWLVTNGLGGYASGTIAGVATRRFHGMLISALPAPFGRRMMLNHISELVRLPDGQTTLLGGQERAGGELLLHGTDCLQEFRMEMGLPVWTYKVNGMIFEKRILLLHMQNTVLLNYRLKEGEGTVRLKLRPSMHFRPHEARMTDEEAPGPYQLKSRHGRYEFTAEAPTPPLRMYLHSNRGAFTVDPQHVELLYRLERARGYDNTGTLWSPGYYRGDLAVDSDMTLVASTENWETLLAMTPAQAFDAEYERRERLLRTARTEVRIGPPRELVLAADQFIIKPAGRLEDAARAAAAGEEVRSVIAGYHWFTDWGRDTMISLEGLALTTGRHAEAGYILRTFSYYVRDGLIPNLFPEGEKEGLYHTADASLWFFHAVHRYVRATDDRETLRRLLPKLHEIVSHHLRGTHFGIGVDEQDGLLRQGAPGYQLTWMDAKVDGWVVTPRRGKAVEINALWYNALRLLENWTREEEGDATRAATLGSHADRAKESFQRRFWHPAEGHLYDVVDGEQGDDPACRPNQLFSISLDHPVLDEQHWEAVLSVTTERLLTPLGLRTLAPGHPDYKPMYYGDLRARDAAYHQGTVWAWLIGPYIDAWLKVHPEDPGQAQQFLSGFVNHLGEACMGSISEIFDAEAPYTPRGCIAQAWSIAEVLRCWARLAGPPPADQQAAGWQEPQRSKVTSAR